MIPENRLPTHPGEILLEEFLKPASFTLVDFAAHLGVSAQRLNQVARGKRGVTPATAWLFAQALGTTPEFWTNLQTAYDLALSKPKRAVERLALHA